MKRAKLEKNKDDEQKPQELKEEDIQRSENETTKNVAVVRLCHFHPLLPADVFLAYADFGTYGGNEDKHLQIYH